MSISSLMPASSVFAQDYNLASGVLFIYGLVITFFITCVGNFDICDSFVYNIMIDMYGTCGGLESSVSDGE